MTKVAARVVKHSQAQALDVKPIGNVTSATLVDEHKLYHAKFGDLISNVIRKAKFVIDMYNERHFDFYSNLNLNSDLSIYVLFNDCLNQISFI